MLRDMIDLLSPHCETVPERRALLRETLGARSPLLNEITYDGPTREFVVNMLAALAHQSEALDALLDVAKDHVGENHAQDLEALRPALHEWARTGAYKEAFDTKTPLRAETTR